MKEQVTEKRPYEAPQLTVVTFRTERGYAGSELLRTLALSFAIAEQGNGSQLLESREAGGSWGGNDWQ